MDDNELIQELLYRGEGGALDYKVKQYPFSGAEDAQKAELLKDILAFANGWRTETAYILIGVKNDTGELVDLDVDIDDSRLQEFVNSKTNHPVNFSYRSLEYDGTKLGLYTIPVQDRPVYVRKQFGRVAPNTVYVRRGSATAIADPSEIAKMGISSVAQSVAHSPKLIVKVVCPDFSVSDRLILSYARWVLDKDAEYVDYSAVIHRMALASPNKKFYRELAFYLQENSGKVPFLFEVGNFGDNFADDVKLFITVPSSPMLIFKEPYRLLPKPRKILTMFGGKANLDALTRASQRYSINQGDDEWVIKYDLGKIQVGETVRTPEIYMINPAAELESIKGKVLSDQLRCPMEFTIPVEINMSEEVLTMDRLEDVSKLIDKEDVG